MPTFYTAEICMNGHITTGNIEHNPERRETYCHLLCTFAGCEMESISHEDNIQSHRDAIQAHKDAVQAHEDAVQAHRDFSQSQSIENNNAALQTQISKNTSLDGANDDD